MKINKIKCTFEGNETKNKNSLYFSNSTLRESKRIVHFLQLVSHIYEMKDHCISHQEFIELIYNNKKFQDIVTSSTLKKGLPNLTEKDKKDIIKEDFGRKITELKLINFCQWETKDNKVRITLNNIDYNYFFKGIEDEEDIQYYENLSTIILYGLKYRNNLDFITNLILTVKEKWSNLGRKREGISEEELTYLYFIEPILRLGVTVEDLLNKKIEELDLISDNVIYDTDVFAQEIIYYRLSWENKYKNKKIIFSEFLSKFTKEIQEKAELINSINLKKLASCNDYINTTVRALINSSCFIWSSNSIIINPYFESKLNYFLSKDKDYLLSEILNKTIKKDLKIFEINYLSNNNISEPFHYRYDQQYVSRKKTYLEKDKKKHKQEINDLIKEFNFERRWYLFEHLNNNIATYYLQHLTNIELSDSNIKYAIKLDHYGDYKNSTTPGVEDFSYRGPDFNFIIESSTLGGFQARSAEISSIKQHTENIFNQTNIPTLTVLVLADNISPQINKDLIESNFLNKEIGIDCFYLALSFENYKNNFLEDDKEITKKHNVLEIIEDIKQSLIFYSKEPTFNKLPLKTLKIK